MIKLFTSTTLNIGTHYPIRVIVLKSIIVVLILLSDNVSKFFFRMTNRADSDQTAPSKTGLINFSFII